MDKKPSVLNIGLDGNHPLTASGPWTPEQILESVNSTRVKMHELGYSDYQAVMVDPDKIEDELTALLKQQHWDALILGGAFKMVPGLNNQLEDIINITRTLSPKTQILFTYGPAGVLESIKRIKT